MISPTMQGKRITVYVNGDPFMKGKQITLNTHQFPQFDKFCDFLTDTVPNRTGGCYRRVYTPNGSEVRALDQIEAGCEYVASKDRYRRVSKEYTYREIPEKTRIPRHKGFKKIDINKVYTPVQHAIEERLRKKSGRSFYLNEHVRGLILRVHINGFNERAACPVAIRSKDKNNMIKIKESIESTMGLQPIERMFHIINCGGYEENFAEIHDCSELEHNGHILVLTKNEKRVQPKLYSLNGKHNFTVATSPRSGQYYLYPSFPPDSKFDSKQYKHNQSLNKHKPLPSIGSSSKQSDAVSPFSNPPSQHGRGGRRSKGKAQNVDYDRDDAGVYRAKGQNNVRGAQQVNDTYETHTERPIDQMEAEEVDEERIQTEKGTSIPPGTELNKQPSVEQKQHEKETHVDKEERTSEEQAATRIQAGARGYKVRKEHRQRMEAAQREKAERETEVGGRRSVEDDLYRRQDAAATKIQAGYKGYKTRKEVNTKKAQVSEEEILDKPRSDNYAASKIQAGYRGYKTRKEYNARKTFSKHGEPEKEAIDYRQGDENIAKEKAAVKIQAGYRGYKTRKAYASRKEAKKVVNDLMANERQDEITYSENHERAATKIQAGFKGYRARKEYNVKKEAKRNEERQIEDAATKIQAGFKGYQTRKKVAETKQEHSKEESAATKIQAGYRGYKTRKEIKSKVINRFVEDKKLDAVHLPYPVPVLAASDISKRVYNSGSNKNLVTSLQAAVKGYNVRKGIGAANFTVLVASETNKHCFTARSHNDLVSSLQAALRGYKARKTLISKNSAASKIQAAYKSHKKRVIKGFASKSFEFEAFKKYKAAIKINSVVRGFLERKNAPKKLSDFKEIENTVSSSWIHHRDADINLRHTPQGPSYVGMEKSYWEDSNIKMYSDQIKKNAATKMQSAFFSFLTRKKYYAWKARQAKKYIAAEKIKSCVKGFITRKEKQNASISPNDDDDFVRVAEPESAVEIYGRVNIGTKLSDKTHHEDLSDKDSCFTEMKSLNESYLREKSLGYETVSASGEVEKEGDSVKEIEDEAGEINAIAKHVNAISCLQAAFRAYRMRKEFQELLSGGGELIDIAKVDRAVSALRKEFRFRSAKMRRLAAHQFNSDQGDSSSNWWIAEGTNDTEIDPSNVFSRTDLNDQQQNNSASVLIRDVILTNDDLLVSEEQNKTAVTERNKSSEVQVNLKSKLKIQASFKGFLVRKQFCKDKSNRKAVRKIQDVFRGYNTRKRMPDMSYDTSSKSLQKHYDGSVVSFDREKDTVCVCTPNVLKTSSTAVQAACRGFLYRKQFSDKTEGNKAAGNILAAVKGFIVRKEHLSNKLMRERLADRVKAFNEAKSSLHKEECKASVIQSVCRGYLLRRKRKIIFAKRLKKDAVCKIQAVFSGYLTRNKQKSNMVDYGLIAKDGSSETDWSETTTDDVDTCNIKQASALKLQAAFSAYQTRKVFISLTKLVEDGSVSDVGTYTLERMGSLSETDDFKLRHKSVTKIQTALEEHRLRNASGIAVTVNGSFPSSSNFSRSRHAGNRSHKGRTILSPIKSQSNVASVLDAKIEKSSQATKHEKKAKEPSQKLSKTKVSKIEKYIKLNLAASIIQATLRGYKKRKVVHQGKLSKSANSDQLTLPKSGKKSKILNDKIAFDSVHKTDKDLIHARTASVKLEAERRKEIKKRVAAKESTHAVKSKAEKLKAEKEKERKGQIDAEINDKSITLDKQEEQGMERQIDVNTKINNSSSISVKKAEKKKEGKNQISTKINDTVLKSAQTSAAVLHSKDDLEAGVSKIQSAYVGDEVQSEPELRKRKRNFHEEYETWKEERINAAIMIQAGWRGYRVRKDIMKQEDTVFGSFSNNDEPQPLIVINLGRSKSEIARAEDRYNNASMMQMVYRTCKMRRKIKIRMAVNRYERNQAVSKIQAYYKAFTMRKRIEQKKIAVRLQAAFKAHRARQLNDTEKQLKRHNAVSRIQAAWKSFKKRQENKIEKEARRKKAEANDAALVIQTGYRGFIERKQLLKKKKEIQHLAATRTQSILKGVLYRKNVGEKRNAASYIISAYRSYKTRLELKRLRDKQNAASRIQCACRAHAKRTKVKIFKDKMAKETKAANIISCSLRGMKARKNEIIRREVLKKKQDSALKIQSFYRGYLGRKMAEVIKREKIRKENLLKKQRTSAIKIQSVYRGHIGRKIARHERYIKELYDNSSEIIELLLGRTFTYLEKKWKAAVQVQACFRGHKTRMRHAIEKEKARAEAVKRKHEMDKMATIIQTVLRAKMRRSVLAEAHKLKIENNAAVKIQSLYRGYSTRLEIEREKVRLARLSPIVLSPDSGKVSVDLELLQNARAIIAFHKNATLLQSAIRAYMMRDSTRERLIRKLGISQSLPRQTNSSGHGLSLSEEEKAAVSIQKTFRGYSDRKAYQSHITGRRKKENAAANIVKVSMKGYTMRKERRNLRDKIKREGSAEVRKQKYLAASVIAAVFRGHQKRKHKAAVRVEM